MPFAFGEIFRNFKSNKNTTMKNLNVLIITLILGSFYSCKVNKEPAQPKSPEEQVTVSASSSIKMISFSLEPKSDSNVTGDVTFTETNGTVAMNATLTGLTSGEHAVHIHEKADCSAADATSTGGHWNPTFAPHGAWGSSEGYHKGDIGNFTADENGNGTMDFSTTEWCIGCGDDSKDITGKAVIVHQGVDDFVTQPTGAAGGRISCAGIIQ